jgi:hypothetical protein
MSLTSLKFLKYWKLIMKVTTMERRPPKKNLGAISLTLHTRKRGVCRSFRMGTKMKWQVHQHLTNKSHAQSKQCRWLIQMESTLGHGLVLDSLHSHKLNLKKGHHPSSYNIFWISPWRLHWMVEMPTIFNWEFQSSQIMSPIALQVHNFSF